MASDGTATVTLPEDRQILITRAFDAPRALVYEAWTTPELVKRWWSGGSGEMSVVEIDLRVGGAWRYVIAGEGHVVGFHGEFSEIVPEERLVQTEFYEGMPGTPPSITTTTFAEAGGRTTVQILMVLESQEIRDAIIETGMETGMQEQMNLLERVLRELR